MSAVCEFRNVGKTFGDFTALADLSFQIAPGEIVGFLGPNGAGKSTSLKLLTGLRRPTSGTVHVFGEAPTAMSVRGRVGMTPQELEFPPTMKVREVLHFLALAYGRGEPDLWREKLHLEKVWGRRTQGLSGGEKRRLGLACALIAAPDLLLLDEPTTGLDVESRRLLWEVVRDERRRGVTILLTTHYLEEIEALSDRVIVIDQGRKLFAGEVKEIRRQVRMSKIEFEMPTGASVEFQRVPHLSFDCRDSRHYVLWSRDSDQSLRALVEAGVDFRHLSVHPASLEEAFIQLRASGSRDRADGGSV
ncbi:MAG: ABC transporter ATP-binding protein [Bdellovibrionaceae bacterium]|nr:ABC transporter ATP-binding protein [Pseudobdellovibrionaceae bacterium]